jgi:cytoskeletal protein RodZ
MELVIIVGAVAVGIWYFFYRNKETIKELSEKPLVPGTYSYPVVMDPNPITLPIVETISAPAVEEKKAPVVSTTLSPRTAKPKAAARTAKPKAKQPQTASKQPVRSKKPKMIVSK